MSTLTDLSTVRGWCSWCPKLSSIELASFDFSGTAGARGPETRVTKITPTPFGSAIFLGLNQWQFRSRRNDLFRAREGRPSGQTNLRTDRRRNPNRTFPAPALARGCDTTGPANRRAARVVVSLPDRFHRCT